VLGPRYSPVAYFDTDNGAAEIFHGAFPDVPLFGGPYGDVEHAHGDSTFVRAAVDADLGVGGRGSTHPTNIMHTLRILRKTKHSMLVLECDENTLIHNHGTLLAEFCDEAASMGYVVQPLSLNPRTLGGVRGQSQLFLVLTRLDIVNDRGLFAGPKPPQHAHATIASCLDPQSDVRVEELQDHRSWLRADRVTTRTDGATVAYHSGDGSGDVAFSIHGGYPADVGAALAILDDRPEVRTVRRLSTSELIRIFGLPLSAGRFPDYMTDDYRDANVRRGG